jgi:hypothetical protein
MMNQYDTVVLATDLPEHSLTRGDVGTVIMVHADDAGYEVEFVTLEGETVAVVTLAASKVRPVAHGEIAHARPVAS